jgi:hypothetical protein
MIINYTIINYTIINYMIINYKVINYTIINYTIIKYTIINCTIINYTIINCRFKNFYNNVSADLFALYFINRFSLSEKCNRGQILTTFFAVHSSLFGLVNYGGKSF